MLIHGIPVIVVSRMLGHAKPSITLDVYGHLLPSMQIEAAEKIDVLITPVTVQQVAPGCTRKRPFHDMVIDRTPISAPIKAIYPQGWGYFSGRNRTRTYDLFCVSAIEGESIMLYPLYMVHIVWTIPGLSNWYVNCSALKGQQGLYTELYDG